VKDAEYLAGQFLLAMPGMGDPRFDKAVIALCSHDENGAVGIGLGAVVGGIGFHAVLEQLDIPVGQAPDAPVHFGGPVEIRRGFVIHSADWTGQDTVDVAGRWRLSSTIDILRAISEGTGPAHWVCALGYAGWSAGQLDEELTSAGWFTAPGDPELIWSTPAADRWTRGYEGAGIDPRLLVAGAGHA